MLFIFKGMELACYFIGKAKSVTVVGSGRTSVPFEKLLGERVGNAFKKVCFSFLFLLC